MVQYIIVRYAASIVGNQRSPEEEARFSGDKRRYGGLFQELRIPAELARRQELGQLPQQERFLVPSILEDRIEQHSDSRCVLALTPLAVNAL